MAFETHISMETVDERIDHFIRQNEAEPYEDGPIAKDELYEFIIAGIADEKFDLPEAVCEHVRRRLREEQERE